MQEDSYCDKCRLNAARETFRCQGVIETLGTVGKSFCYHLGDTVMPPDVRQTIDAAKNDSEALGHIRTVCLKINHEKLCSKKCVPI